jgi:hypothetical protein
LKGKRGSEQYHPTKLVNRMPIAALRLRRRQASKHGRFRVIQIRNAELGFPPSQVPFLAFAPRGWPSPDGWPRECDSFGGLWTGSALISAGQAGRKRRDSFIGVLELPDAMGN